MTWYENANQLDLSPELFTYSEYPDHVFVFVHWILLSRLENVDGEKGLKPILLHVVTHDKPYGTCDREFLMLEADMVVFINRGRPSGNHHVLMSTEATVALYVNHRLSRSTLEQLQSPYRLVVRGERVIFYHRKKCWDLTDILSDLVWPPGGRAFRHLITADDLGNL